MTRRTVLCPDVIHVRAQQCVLLDHRRDLFLDSQEGTAVNL